MVFNRTFLCVLFLYLTFVIAYAKPLEDEEEISYVESIINFEHQNDKWICGDLECPENTFGCKLRVKNDQEGRKFLTQTFDCFDKDHNDLMGSYNFINLEQDKNIDIELKTYEDAVSTYVTGYGSGGHESVNGVVAVNDIEMLKEDFKKNMKNVIESNNS